MSNQTSAARSAIENLLRVPDDETLFERLGLRIPEVPRGSPRVAEFDPALVHDQLTMGPLDAVREIGRRVFKRWSRELHSVICGKQEQDQKDRTSILSQMGLGDVAAGTALATVLMGGFGVAPAIATVVAALVVKRILKPGGEEFCKYWGENLD